MKKIITLTLVLTLVFTSVFATQALAVQKKKSAKKVKEKIVKCTINFNGGQYRKNGKTYKKLVLRSRGGHFTIYCKNLKYKKRYYSFRGLYTKKKGGRPYIDMDRSDWLTGKYYSFTLKKNTTLYAQWVQGMNDKLEQTFGFRVTFN